MRTIKADLLDDVVGTYDQTKTTIQGRVFEKTIDGDSVLGPPVTKYIDVFNDTGQTPVAIHCSDNGRLFITTTPVNGTSYDTMPIMLYDFNFDTGVYAYVGRIDVQLPNLGATTHLVRALKVIDTGTTGWKIFIATTATVLINGGLFLVNKIDKADFIPIGFPVIPMALSSDSKSVYLLQDPSNIGAGQLNIAAAGAVLDQTNNRIYVHNGVAATHQYYVYDTAIAPTWTTNAVTGTEATNIINDAGHSFVNGTPLVFSSITGGAGLVVNTPYFVVGAVAGVSYQLSLTSGGAAINFTTDISAANIGRAWGTTGSNWLHKTGNLPALTGTLLLTDSEDFAVPVNSPTNGGVLNGNSCAFFATSSQLYLGLLSELTSGAVLWPSLSTSNIFAGVNEIVAPTAANASWSNILDSATYVTNTSKFITKQLINNSIDFNFGELNNEYYELNFPESVVIGQSAAPTSMDHAQGWLFVGSSSTGQRGVFTMDMRSECFYDYSFIVTKVLDTAKGKMKAINSIEKLWPLTGNLKFQYRTSGFGSISGGWTNIEQYTDLSAIATDDQIQFKLGFFLQSEGSSNPSQVSEVLFTYLSDFEISDYWEYSDDYSDNTSPSRTAFRLKKVYDTSVPTLNYLAYDLSDVLLVDHDTVTNAANFEYSTDGGTVWLPLGTIPNTVGTLVRYTFTSPPGVDIRPVIRE